MRDRTFLALLTVAVVLLSLARGLGKPAAHGPLLVLWYVADTTGFICAGLLVTWVLAGAPGPKGAR